ncbi:MAG: hypothetical protein NTX03_06130 [Bacteroidetes bacterium]|nr:hypothetical protein [Bacteroidota bacterium]
MESGGGAWGEIDMKRKIIIVIVVIVLSVIGYVVFMMIDFANGIKEDTDSRLKLIQEKGMTYENGLVRILDSSEMRDITVHFFQIDTSLGNWNVPYSHQGLNILNFTKKAKNQLTNSQKQDLERLSESPSLHSDIDCGTIWQDGVFVYSDKKGCIKKIIVVSLNCYDLIINDEEKVNLNLKGQRILLTLLK